MSLMAHGKTIGPPDTKRNARLTRMLLVAVAVHFVLHAMSFDVERIFGLPLLFRANPAKPLPTEAIIITLDSASADDLGLPRDIEKWPRSIHVHLLERLAAANARIIVYDVVFSETTSRTTEEDRALATAIRDAGNVVLASAVVDQSESMISHRSGLQTLQGASNRDLRRLTCVLPSPTIADAALAMAPSLVTGKNGTIDTFWSDNPAPCASPTLAAIAAHAYLMPLLRTVAHSMQQSSPGNDALSKDIQQIPISHGFYAIRARLRNEPAFEFLVNVASRTASTHHSGDFSTRFYTGRGSHYFNFYGPALTIPTYRVADILRSTDEDGPLTSKWDAALSDKAIFVGVSESSRDAQKESSDAFRTPITRDGELQVQGVELTATAFLNLLHGNWLERPGAIATISISMLLTLIAWWAIVSQRSSRSLIATATVIFCYVLIAQFVFFAGARWLPLFTPLVSVVIALGADVSSRYLSLARERLSFVRALTIRIPRRVLNEYVITGRIRSSVDAACLISDLSDWTTRVSQSADFAIADSMRRYLDEVMSIVRTHDGFVVDTAGDGLLALWIGENAALVDQRQSAIDCALAMVNHAKKSEIGSAEPAAIRIGLHFGSLVLRDIGDDEHFQVKPFGIAVPTAKRLEALNKQFGTSILVTDAFAEGLTDYAWISHGRAALSGTGLEATVLSCKGQRPTCDG